MGEWCRVSCYKVSVGRLPTPLYESRFVTFNAQVIDVYGASTMTLQSYRILKRYATY